MFLLVASSVLVDDYVDGIVLLPLSQCMEEYGLFAYRIHLS
jgi:hypothetical protein